MTTRVRLYEVAPGVRVLAFIGELQDGATLRIKGDQVVYEEPHELAERVIAHAETKGSFARSADAPHRN